MDGNESSPEAGHVYTGGSYWADRHDAESAYKVDLVDELLERLHMPLSSGMRLAEVGSGQGAFLIPFAERLRTRSVEADISAWDISAQAIELGRERSEDKGLKVDWTVGSAAQLPTGWDYVFVMDVLEHLENPAQFLRDLAGKSRYILLHLPVEQSLGHMVKNMPARSYDAFAHLQFYSFDSARILLQDSPFTEVAHHFSGASRATLGRHGSRLVRASRVARYRAYQFNPRWASILGGGSVLWLLEDKSQDGRT